jgi:hypothetical protein
LEASKFITPRAAAEEQLVHNFSVRKCTPLTKSSKDPGLRKALSHGGGGLSWKGHPETTRTQEEEGNEEGYGMRNGRSTRTKEFWRTEN